VVCVGGSGRRLSGRGRRFVVMRVWVRRLRRQGRSEGQGEAHVTGSSGRTLTTLNMPACMWSIMWQ
jgi:hypothetical protein